MAKGMPYFINARAMHDGMLAVAIRYGDEVVIGRVSLNGLSMYDQKGDYFKAQLITNGSDFLSITPEQYNSLTFHQEIPYYKDIPALPAP